MQTEEFVSKRGYSELRRSLRPLAAAALLWPAVAAAQPPNPTASDANGNTAAGTAALLNVTGDANTASGYSALYSNTTGDFNTASGYDTLRNNTEGSGNTASGTGALYFNSTGAGNTASGQAALYSNTTGDFNTASGDDALRNNTTGRVNTASGEAALYSNTTGNGNTASGEAALYSNTTGNGNTASGYFALEGNTTGRDNTASGADALTSNTGGKQNTAIGNQALFSIPTGISNVAVGYNALSALTGASGGNIALGANAGNLTKAGNNNIYIGNYGIANTESNVTRIGRTQTKVFVKGIAGVPLSGATVVVNSAGQLGVVASSARYKQDIRPLTGASERLAELRPVFFSYKTDPGGTHYGLIAEEVDKVMPELVVRDEQNRPESVQYLELIPLLLEERQELQATLERQQSELERERALIEQQAEALGVLRRTLDTRLSALEQSNGEDVASLK